LPRADLVKTGPVDHADWNYKLHLAWVSRARLRMVVRMLPTRVNRLLEIGYGSGVLMPELAARCAELHGIDPHSHHEEVAAKLRAHGVAATLVSGTAERLPYPDGHFDHVVSVSALEFVPNADAACREVARVLAPAGRFVVVTPGHSKLVDLGLKLLTGASATADYGDRRQQLLPTLFEHFRPLRRSAFPSLVGRAVPLYRAFEFVRK
jgi:SAM-dependent methyltransferase